MMSLNVALERAAGWEELAWPDNWVNTYYVTKTGPILMVKEILLVFKLGWKVPIEMGLSKKRHIKTAAPVKHKRLEGN